MAKQEYRKGNHCVFSIQAHSYFVTKYRKPVLKPEMITVARTVMEKVLEKNQCLLLEYGGEPDHLHLLIDVHPDNNISQLLGSLKSATSRVLRREFPELVRFCRKGLWGKQLYIRSAGGAPLATLKKYIETHSYG